MGRQGEAAAGRRSFGHVVFVLFFLGGGVAGGVGGGLGGFGGFGAGLRGGVWGSLGGSRFLHPAQFKRGGKTGCCGEALLGNTFCNRTYCLSRSQNQLALVDLSVVVSHWKITLRPLGNQNSDFQQIFRGMSHQRPAKDGS